VGDGGIKPQVETDCQPQVELFFKGHILGPANNLSCVRRPGGARNRRLNLRLILNSTCGLMVCMSIQDTIRVYGLTRLAEGCGVTPQAVFKWLDSGFPAERVLDIERITGVSRHELRPDIYPVEPKKKSAA
jgi:DNA-binding transcriptional regulator YdaS (Cro superfamily)